MDLVRNMRAFGGILVVRRSTPGWPPCWEAGGQASFRLVGPVGSTGLVRPSPPARLSKWESQAQSTAEVSVPVFLGGLGIWGAVTPASRLACGPVAGEKGSVKEWQGPLWG